jgi:hypothetical protein
MKMHRVGSICALAFLASFCFGTNKVLAFQADEEVLTRGPVHEAFAETVLFNPEKGMLAPKPPPAAIEEVPPDERPEGVNVEWIPGYWSWDDERGDYIWVSGVWRALPPGREWVAGYWVETPQGAQWISGYWADASAAQVEYLSEAPPATIEVGPSVAAPSDNFTWIPGTWVWHHGRYAWRPGYWAAVQPDWIWVPAHYTWAPRGCGHSPRVSLCPGHGDRSAHVHRSSILAAAFPPLLLWRLLRRRLRTIRICSVVFSSGTAYWL